MRNALFVLPLLPFVAACTPSETPAVPDNAAVATAAPAAAPLSAILRDAAGANKGTATVMAAGNTMTVTVEAMGMTAGEKGLHIHEVGKCEGPKFTSAGAHWNPAAKQHGRDNPQGAHLGDAPNITIGQDGRGTAVFTVEGMPASLTEGAGKSIIIHAAPDDYRTDPSGNSGDRMACGVFAR